MRFSMVDAQLWSMAVSQTTPEIAIQPIQPIPNHDGSSRGRSCGSSPGVDTQCGNWSRGGYYSHFNQFLNSASSPLICSFPLIICFYFPFKNIVLQKGKGTVAGP
jgi:hypothetical protein